MKIDLTKIEFDQDDLNSIHEVIFNALNKEDLTNDEIISYWNMLPDNIKFDALNNGLDTVVRDNMYVWFQENCENN